MKGAPFFIVGCGRSGTTALGEVLGSHPQIKYLNEPRPLWRNDPRTDVWSGKAGAGARLDLYDVDEDTRALLRKRFFSKAGPNDRLLEKTPVNSFRIDYIRSLFPNARFLHLLRNGLHVARSIGQRFESGGGWFGAGDVKWKLLVDYAQRHDLEAKARAADDDGRLRGLLEWRLAVSHTRERLTDRDLEIRYEDLVMTPQDEVRRVLDWMGLPGSDVDASVLARPLRPSEAVDEEAHLIAGDLLRELGYAPTP